MSAPREVPAPVLDAMREWLADQPGWTRRDVFWRTDEQIVGLIDDSYPDRAQPLGVEAFLRDHSNEGGEQ